jgi:DNA repair protein RadA/Sms
MVRSSSRFVCQACGDSFLRWDGQCRGCGAWNTLVETLVREESRSRRTAGRATPAGPGSAAGGDVQRPVPLAAGGGTDPARISVGIGEVDRVLGGGLVAGSLVLLVGEPGVGKSTLVLAMAAGIAAQAGAGAGRAGQFGSVLYASGEESVGQLRLRARRLGLADGPVGEAVHVLAETDVERIVEEARAMRPALVIVDSIQTVTQEELSGPPGSVGQVREAASRLQGLAKGEGIPVLLVGHVTKDGTLAGPRTLEHLVDAVLTLDGDRGGSLRLLRASKNRYGSTEEVGVLAMGASGLQEVTDPARAFLADDPVAAPGSAVAATLEGTRPLLVEVQALVAPAGYANPRRTVSGVDPSRLALLVAVLGRRAGVTLGSHEIYASVAGGITIEEPALDLPLALALASSLRNRPLHPGTVAAGEVGLLGELRAVTGLERRLREAERLGFRLAIVPRAGRSGEHLPARIGGLEVAACRTLREALEAGITAG